MLLLKPREEACLPRVVGTTSCCVQTCMSHASRAHTSQRPTGHVQRTGVQGPRCARGLRAASDRARRWPGTCRDGAFAGRALRQFLVFLLGQGCCLAQGHMEKPPLSGGLGIWTLGWVGPPRGVKGVVGSEGDLVKHPLQKTRKSLSQNTPTSVCPSTRVSWLGFSVGKRVVGGSPVPGQAFF